MHQNLTIVYLDRYIKYCKGRWSLGFRCRWSFWTNFGFRPKMSTMWNLIWRTDRIKIFTESVTPATDIVSRQLDKTGDQQMGFAVFHKSIMFVLFQKLQFAFFLLELLQWGGHIFLIPCSQPEEWMPHPSLMKINNFKKAIALHPMSLYNSVCVAEWARRPHRYVVNNSISWCQLLKLTRQFLSGRLFFMVLSIPGFCHCSMILVKSLTSAGNIRLIFNMVLKPYLKPF